MIRESTIQEDTRDLFITAADNIRNNNSIDNTLETVELFLEKLPKILTRLRN